MKNTRRTVAVALLGAGIAVTLMLGSPAMATADPGNGQGNGQGNNGNNGNKGNGQQTPGPQPVAASSKTQENLLAAMHGEAFATAAYENFSILAAAGANAGLMVPLANATPSLDTAWEGLNGGVVKYSLSLPDLFTYTAYVEYREHFTEESVFANMVGSTAQNLQTAINGENYETTTMYPGFADAARRTGDTVAANLFSDIAGDEAIHRDNYQAALNCLNAGGSVATVNACVSKITLPVLDRVALDTSGAKVTKSKTFDNLSTAMHGEAYAYASYMAFADKANADGYTAIGALFAATAPIERYEHFREEGNIAGTWGSDAANLRTAISGETYESTSMYPSFAKKASVEGYYDVAALFQEITGDEWGHAQNYTVALSLVK